MYIPEIEFCEDDYITTSSGNIVSRSAVLHRPESVEIPGGKCILREHVNIHGDLAPVKINRYTIVNANTILKPPEMVGTTVAFKHIPMSIGKYVIIGKGCMIESAALGMVRLFVPPHIIPFLAFLNVLL